jgi:ketosteroid isomerase-like protein
VVHKRAIFVFAAAAFFLALSVAHSQDLKALQASFEANVGALNSLNPNAFVSSAHNGIVLVGTLSPFPVSGKDKLQQVVEQYLSTNERVTFTLVNPQFRVAGTTGIAWGHYSLTNKPKEGPLEYTHGRYTYTYTNIDRKWALVAMHFSPLQPTYYMAFQ